MQKRFTWYCTHTELHPLSFVVAGGGIYYYYINQGNKSDKKRKIVKKLSFMHTKRFNTFFKWWVQFRLGAIPRLHAKTNFFGLESWYRNLVDIYLYGNLLDFQHFSFFPINTYLIICFIFLLFRTYEFD